MKNKIINFLERLSSKKNEFINDSFNCLKKIKFLENDFVYLDPAYLLGEATYNSDWNRAKEISLYSVLEKLNSKGVKFAISNVIEHKGK
ncbi:DNA adenine methylase [Mesoplasma coleopterae]|uniref:DNA adenine methylase n=1 Tax=Mesoplasma coleopterae TaxID=324078 RepID=UPI000D0413C0|nr:DNA adenine methylase [Mesoplasma coleopterae]AVN63228.1 hypothetical protein CG000_02945 [Mesoplasma coleopterae]